MLVGIVIGERICVWEVIVRAIVPVRPPVIEVRVGVVTIVIWIVETREEEESIDQPSQIEKK